jgi:hypothetical protein
VNIVIASRGLTPRRIADRVASLRFTTVAMRLQVPADHLVTS